MHHIRVDWRHELFDEPVELYSELDQENLEVRKVEVFSNRAATFAWRGGRTGSSKLGEVPVPPMEEIARDPQFVPVAITINEFENVWHQATATGIVR